MGSQRDIDVCLVGGGLQTCLIALLLRLKQPELRILIVERASTLCGNHTWSFLDFDVVSAGSAGLVDKIAEHRWPTYQVRFDSHQRTIHSGYTTISSDRLRQAVMSQCDERMRVMTQCDAIEITRTQVTIVNADGSRESIQATFVMDNRGAAADDAATGGFQKFVGIEIETATPHSLQTPIIMDAQVDQSDGYRFMYVLPLSATRLLVEDTYFSDSSRLEVAEVRHEIVKYAAAHHWQIARMIREETGILPLPWHARGPMVMPDQPVQGGYRGGWFHPATGYSFALAWRVATVMAGAPLDTWQQKLATLANHVRSQQRFALRLNWMLFQWFTPAQRHNVLSRFYRLPADTISRFYSLEMSALDRARVLIGRPPKGMSWKAFWSAGKLQPLGVVV
jgi:lycopene beta-cyclase